MKSAPWVCLFFCITGACAAPRVNSPGWAIAYLGHAVIVSLVASYAPRRELSRVDRAAWWVQVPIYIVAALFLIAKVGP